MTLARLVAMQSPCSEPARTHVDHGIRETTDNRCSSIHFVTSQFNAFNNPKKEPASGFHGVVKYLLRYRAQHWKRPPHLSAISFAALATETSLTRPRTCSTRSRAPRAYSPGSPDEILARINTAKLVAAQAVGDFGGLPFYQCHPSKLRE
ncbi:hypothetical protein sr13764 [Sporisorium reilianum SRZ2]|uniref:Uncharacterized protein n=1 Tax=Sporisorium reilianum (strain SRZ2) TaxID=999809 RepID=E7A0U4_SPORE|nr:hypothetical protein sr13764 [Sporisorium reilianum SRZ2]